MDLILPAAPLADTAAAAVAPPSRVTAAAGAKKRRPSKEAARARSPGELGRVDQVGFLSCHDCYFRPILSSTFFTMKTSQVCQEFMDLKIPRHAEILDVAAGSGILSAEIQTGGYEERE